MKKIKIYLTILILGLLISCQTDWKEDYEKIIEKSERDFKVIKQVDTIVNLNTQTKIHLYQTSKILKLEVNFKMENYFDVTNEYYKNDSIVFTEKINGIVPFVYKRERKNEEPIGELIERISYFKDKRAGVEKLRKVDFYLGDDVEKRNDELRKLDFEIKEIGEKEYSQIEKTYNRYNKY